MSDYCRSFVKKHKHNGEIEFRPVYFNSVTKTIINHRFRLGNSFQETLYMIVVWVNNGSGWIIELIKSQYLNILIYKPYQEALTWTYLLN